MEPRQVERDAVHRLDLEIDQAAVALAFLHEQRLADLVGIVDIGQIGVCQGDRATRGDLIVPENLDAITLQMTRLGKELHHHTRIVRVILPSGQTRCTGHPSSRATARKQRPRWPAR